MKKAYLEGHHAAIRTRILACIRMHEDECRTQAGGCSAEMRFKEQNESSQFQTYVAKNHDCVKKLKIRKTALYTGLPDRCLYSSVCLHQSGKS